MPRRNRPQRSTSHAASNPVLQSVVSRAASAVPVLRLARRARHRRARALRLRKEVADRDAAERLRLDHPQAGRLERRVAAIRGRYQIVERGIGEHAPPERGLRHIVADGGMIRVRPTRCRRRRRAAVVGADHAPGGGERQNASVERPPDDHLAPPRLTIAIRARCRHHGQCIALNRSTISAGARVSARDRHRSLYDERCLVEATRPLLDPRRSCATTPSGRRRSRDAETRRVQAGGHRRGCRGPHRRLRRR